jgi:negative regulator of flagellin synthesis FlgM
MRVDAYNAVSQVYQTNAKFKASAGSNAYSTDKLEISSFGKEFQVAKTAVSQASDVREDKVEQIKSMLSSGTYSVSSVDFANKIVDGYTSEIAL